jgi:hypothetical protein
MARQYPERNVKPDYKHKKNKFIKKNVTCRFSITPINGFGPTHKPPKCRVQQGFNINNNDGLCDGSSVNDLLKENTNNK